VYIIAATITVMCHALVDGRNCSNIFDITEAQLTGETPAVCSTCGTQHNVLMVTAKPSTDESGVIDESTTDQA
jgi:hypothetical protein